ncbi:hypothetical protein JKP88DRAFT_301904 [Tribonema minus]|uniref:Bulb-type lectin domain-containing protein n=1 Tax=Tribonema minus TaxID=303371 RepID=A0A835ZDK5_9STRA|nr:hypothetical protein JKP88DRAFT_301904 [Tribonema minus]
MSTKRKAAGGEDGASTEAAAGVQSDRDVVGVEAFVKRMREKAESRALKNYEPVLEAMMRHLDAAPRWQFAREVQGKYYDKHEICWMVVGYGWSGKVVSELVIWDQNWGTENLRAFRHEPMQAATRAAIEGTYFDDCHPPDALICDASLVDAVNAFVMIANAFEKAKDLDLAAKLSTHKVAEALWPLAFMIVIAGGATSQDDLQGDLLKWCEPPAHGDTLAGGQFLIHDAYLMSANGRNTLHMTEEGLSLYHGTCEVWNACKPDDDDDDEPIKTVMRRDGNLVILDKAGKELWSSGTAGHPGASLVIQDDGQLAICAGHGTSSSDQQGGANPIWSAPIGGSAQGEKRG